MEELVSLRGMFVLALTLVSIYLTFKDHKYGIIVFIILLFSRDAFLLRLFPPIYITLHLPLVFAFLTLILCFVRSSEYPIQFNPKLWLLLALLVVIYISRIFDEIPNFKSNTPGEFFKMFILFFLFTNTIRSEKDLIQVMLVLIIVNVFSDLYHYYYYRIGSSESIYTKPNIGPLNRNQFAHTLASMIPISYSLLRVNDKKILKIFFAVCTIILMMGTILTYSRSGFLGMGAAILAFVVLDRNKMRNVFIILLIALAMSSRISEKYIGRLKTIDNYEVDASAMGRVAVNSASFNMLKAHPIFGVGAGNFNSVFMDYVPYDLLQWVAPGKSPHNIFMQIGSETGFTGLALFSAFIIWCFVDLIKLRLKFTKHSPPNLSFYITNSLLAGFFAYMVGLQFGQGAYYGYVYIFAPLIASAVKVIKLETKSEITTLNSRQNPDNVLSNIKGDFK